MRAVEGSNEAQMWQDGNTLGSATLLARNILFFSSKRLAKLKTT